VECFLDFLFGAAFFANSEDRTGVNSLVLWFAWITAPSKQRGGSGRIDQRSAAAGILQSPSAFPKDSIVKYESALKADKFVLLAHGTAAESGQGQGHHADDTPSRACPARI